MKKKICYLFVFEGYNDLDLAEACESIAPDYTIRTIAIHKQTIRSLNGLTVLPDLDFIPEVDLDDISSDNTGLLILPGGKAWQEGLNAAIEPLVEHCRANQIDVRSFEHQLM